MKPQVRKISELLSRVDHPEIHPGDKVKLHLRIVEGNKERTTFFMGIVIKISGSKLDKSITVRKISSNIGVEKIIPLNSPLLNRVEVLNRNVVRRAKLYYLRELSGKKARLRERIAR